MKLGETFRWTLVSVPITTLTVIVCVFLMGGGHGTYLPTIFLFPYAMLAALAGDKIGTTSIVLGLSQYLAYGLIIDVSKRTKGEILIRVGLLLFHILTASYVANVRGESF